jgi:hypothetical protein
MLKLTLLVLSLFIPFQQPGWQLSTEKDGIRIYTASTAADAKVKPIKVECTFNATPAQLVAVLLDIKNYTAWAYHTKSATIIKQAGPADLFYYAEVNIPWPGQNRDFVSHLTVMQDVATKVITVEAPNVAGIVPDKQGIYRTNNSKGKWIITPEGDQAKVVYYLQIDAGGDAPSWLVNLFITDGPLQSFKKLRQQLQKAEYKNAVLQLGKS